MRNRCISSGDISCAYHRPPADDVRRQRQRKGKANGASPRALACRSQPPASFQRSTAGAASPVVAHGRFDSLVRSLTHSPEPLMCADTRDRRPPRLAAAWWRSWPTRVDAHRTFGGTIDVARPGGRQHEHTARELTRVNRSPARRITESRPREWYRHFREEEKKEDSGAFIYGGFAVLSVGGGSCSVRATRGMQHRACDKRARNRWIDQPPRRWT